ncbi:MULTISPECIES: sensor histidine kinase [Streptomyces]|uniref:sensor histidine kinase n=1 Tax=Streptomyces TaxID=1883 RepID=UPI000A3966C7|nr:MULTISPECIES: histidine kinase [Streptomyces]MDX3586379.1 histidine kinase [Streptomyces europaeiscabiei]MDX3612424.1 histidine kinase [Streptomyces europaeiscabiei]MDX3635618.1 histidine kinase [Streptomyces europaeiscabiei]MDX3653849.1 histidine kinase [Streptomyces europaeiscabiei]
MTSASKDFRVDTDALVGGSEHRTVVRILTVLASVGRADQRHPRVRRWGVPILCAVLGLQPLLEYPDAGPAFPGSLALLAGITVPLLWRQSHPLLVFVLVTGFSVAEAASGVLTNAHFLAQMIMLYNLARFARPLALAGAVSVAVSQTLVTVVAFSSDIQLKRITSALALAVMLMLGMLAMAGLGLGGRVARLYITALHDRAVRLEVEQAQRARLAEAEERARISREMHDILGHTLAVMVGLADGAAALAEAKPKRSAETLRIIADSGRSALADLRRLLGTIRENGPECDSPLAPQPGLADLDALLERVRAAGPTVTVRTEGDLAGLPAGVQLVAYRIVQEALTNTLKHVAAATTIGVAVVATRHTVRVAVEDSGPPRTPRRSPRGSEGQGLLGMRERAALYQGTVTAGPNSRGGWRVRAELRLISPSNTPTITPTEKHPE